MPSFGTTTSPPRPGPALRGSWVLLTCFTLVACGSPGGGAREQGDREGGPRILWMGVDEDRVGGGDRGLEPDGRMDLHFRVELGDVGRDLAGLALSAVNEIGLPIDPFAWSTDPALDSPLGVFHGQDRLFRVDGTPERVEGGTVLDLYAVETDPSRFGTGSRVLLTWWDPEGATGSTEAVLRLPEWRMEGEFDALCESSAPEAFEMAHFSGRFLLDLTGDGMVGGRFDRFEIRGTVGSDGSFSGEGAAPSGETMTLTGTIDRAEDGSLRGRGTLTLDGGRRCEAGDWWGGAS